MVLERRERGWVHCRVSMGAARSGGEFSAIPRAAHEGVDEMGYGAGYDALHLLGGDSQPQNQGKWSNAGRAIRPARSDLSMVGYLRLRTRAACGNPCGNH